MIHLISKFPPSLSPLVCYAWLRDGHRSQAHALMQAAMGLPSWREAVLKGMPGRQQCREAHPSLWNPTSPLYRVTEDPSDPSDPLYRVTEDCRSPEMVEAQSVSAASAPLSPASCPPPRRGSPAASSSRSGLGPPARGFNVHGVQYALWALSHFPRLRVRRQYLGSLLYWTAEHAWQVRACGMRRLEVGELVVWGLDVGCWRLEVGEIVVWGLSSARWTHLML